MKNERSFFKCTHCGNIIEMIVNTGTKVMCCGQAMTQLSPNTVEAAVEKHIPVATRTGTTLNVTIGSTLHPMIEEHHIAFIVVAQGDRTTRVELSKTGEPTASFTVEDGSVTVYAYCNLHGLWATEC